MRGRQDRPRTLETMTGPSSAASVLWLTGEPPDRSGGGGSIRQAHLFAALAAVVPTDLVTVGAVRDEQVRAAAASVVELPDRQRYWPASNTVRRAARLAHGIGGRRPLECYFAGPTRRSLASALAAAAARRGEPYRGVLVEHEVLAPLLPPVRHGHWALTFHHVLSAMIEHEPVVTGRRQDWWRRRRLAKAQRLEQWAVRSFDRVMACSDEDAAHLRGLAEPVAPDRVAVVPNGVDLDAFVASPVPVDHRIVFTGSLDYWPNVDGVQWFCEEVLPSVRAAVPGVELTIVGRSPTPSIRRLAALPDVALHADVPSVEPFLRSARVAVVPLRVGTGSRLKALEAMSAGRPVVGTTVGLAGLGLADGVQARVADTSAGLAAAVIDLLTDDAGARRLGAAGRSHVEASFGWSRIGAAFAEGIEAWLDTPREAPVRS